MTTGVTKTTLPTEQTLTFSYWPNSPKRLEKTLPINDNSPLVRDKISPQKKAEHVTPKVSATTLINPQDSETKKTKVIFETAVKTSTPSPKPTTTFIPVTSRIESPSTCDESDLDTVTPSLLLPSSSEMDSLNETICIMDDERPLPSLKSCVDPLTRARLSPDAPCFQQKMANSRPTIPAVADSKKKTFKATNAQPCKLKKTTTPLS